MIMIVERMILKDSIDRMTDEQIKSLTIFFQGFKLLDDDMEDDFDTVSDDEYSELLRRMEEMENGEFVTLDEVRAKRMA